MVEPFFRDDRVTVYAESALAVLGDLPANSIDAVCTDPPYAIGLMRTSWDTCCRCRQRVSFSRVDSPIGSVGPLACQCCP